MRFCFCLVLLSLLCGCVDGPAKQSEVPVPTAPPLEQSGGSATDKPGAADADAPKEFTETTSGLKYKLLRKTKGKKPQASDTVRVNYRGTLDDGEEFDSSYGKKPISFPLTGVIPGWTEGLQYCPVGGMIELEIPSNLGYGAQGQGIIPGGATLHFIVELLDIE